MKEIWKDIAGYEGLYQVSNLGRIKSLSRGRILKDSNSYGYRNVCLSKNNVHFTVRVHRLVAMAFIPNPENKLEINHIDGDKTNNKAKNLEWCTRSENALHAVHVLGKKGKGDHLLKYQYLGVEKNKKKVLCVETNQEYESVSCAARTTGICRACIGRCCTGKAYGKRKKVQRTAGGMHWRFV